MKYVLIISIIYVLMFSGCNENSVSPNNSGNIFPLKEGNKWFYTLEGNEDSITTIEIVEKIVHNNRTWYKIKSEKYLWKIFNTTNIYRTDENGLHVTEVNGCCEEIVLKQPTKDSGEYEFGFIYYVEYSSNHKIETTLGQFNCYKFQFDIYRFDPDLRFIYYVKPGIGIIRYEKYIIDSYPKLEFAYNLYETNLIE